VSIDKADKVVGLKGPDGKFVRVELGGVAQNFDQIKLGARFKISYHEAVALYLGKRGAKPKESPSFGYTTAEKGEEPGGRALEIVTMFATVKAVDRDHRIVTLEKPDGHPVRVSVPKSVKAFDALKAGDEILARFSEAIVISMEKP
jgi:hypothetical protein